VVLRNLALAEAIPTVLRPTWVTSLWFLLVGLIVLGIVTGYTMVNPLEIKITLPLKLEHILFQMEELVEMPYQAIVMLNITYQRKTSGTKRLITRLVVLMLVIGLMLPRATPPQHA